MAGSWSLLPFLRDLTEEVVGVRDPGARAMLLPLVVREAHRLAAARRLIPNPLAPVHSGAGTAPFPRLQGFPRWKYDEKHCKTIKSTGKYRMAWRQELRGGDTRSFAQPAFPQPASAGTDDVILDEAKSLTKALYNHVYIYIYIYIYTPNTTHYRKVAKDCHPHGGSVQGDRDTCRGADTFAMCCVYCLNTCVDC